MRHFLLGLSALLRRILQRICKEALHLLHDQIGLLHTALALQARGQETTRGFDKAIAVALERVDVGLCGWVLVHIQVHGRGDENGCLHRQIGRHEHVVGHAMSHLAQRTGGAGRDEHGVGPKAQIDMRVPGAVALGEEVADDRMAAEGRKRDGRDKLLASRRDDNLHLRPSLDEGTDDEARLVGGDAARDAQDDMLTRQGRWARGGTGRGWMLRICQF